jgi:hypothetical protein
MDGQRNIEVHFVDVLITPIFLINARNMKHIKLLQEQFSLQIHAVFKTHFNIILPSALTTSSFICSLSFGVAIKFVHVFPNLYRV